MRDDDREAFERWLQRELRRTLGPISGPSPRARQAAYRRGTRKGPGLALFATGRIAAVGIAVVLALGAGSAVASATTGSANPAQWGEAVVQVVKTCDAAMHAGPGDVGQCVDGLARVHAGDQSSGRAVSPRSGDGSIAASSAGGGLNSGGTSRQPSPNGQPASAARRHGGGSGTNNGNGGKNPDNVPPASGARERLPGQH
jgi:hypothetical protein